MSTTIDERVVEMRFDNQQFKQAAGESLNILQKLGQAIDKSTTGDNVSKMAKSIDGINFGKAVAGVESLADRFSVLGIVGKRVIENLTDGLMGKFSSAVHSMTNSIVSGGINRAMNIENARFQLNGIINDAQAVENGFKNAGEMVQKVMDQASDSVDGTAYAYDSAAKAASMFAASGVKVGDQMENSLKSVAGVAATFNASYEEIADVFTTVAGQGKLMAYQMNQLSFRGMNAAASLADYFNQVKKDPSIASEEVAKAITKMTGNLEVNEAQIRDFVSKGKINFDIFSEAMATTFGDHAKDANKTFTGSMANIRAALARTGEMFVLPLIKEEGAFVRFFNSIRKKINDFNKALQPLATEVTKFINRTVKRLSREIDNIHVGTLAHAFTIALQGVGNALKGIMTFLRPIGEAFTETFGGITYKNILDSAIAFKKLTAEFKASEKTAATIKTVAKGVFDVIKTGIELVGRFIGALTKAPDLGKNMGDSLLDAFSSFGETLSNISKLVSESKLLDSIFEKIGNGAQKIKEVFTSVVTAFSDLPGTFSNLFSGFENPFKRIGEFFSGIEVKGFGQSLKDLIGSFNIFKNEGSQVSALGEAIKAVSPVFTALAGAVDKVSSALADAVRNGNLFKGLLDTVRSVSLSGFIFSINGFINSLTRTINKSKELKSQNPFEDLIDTFLGPLKSTTKVLDEFKKSITRITSGIVKDLDAVARYVDAQAIKKIAESILILAVALKVLASINPDKLAASLGAVTAMLIELVGAMLVLDKFMGKSSGFKNALAGFVDSMKLGQLASALLKMAGAVLILSIAVKYLSDLSWEELAKGLGAVTVLLFELVAVANLIDPKALSSTGTGLIFVAVALRILVKAVSSLGSMNIETLVQGLIAVGVALFELGLFTRLADKGGLGKGLGLIAMATALLIVGKVMSNLSSLSWDQIKKGLVAMGVSLLAMTMAIDNMPDKGAVRKAFAAIEMALAMLMIAKALSSLSELNTDGLTAATFAMSVMMYAMSKSINEIPDEKGVRKAFAAIEMALALILIAKALEPLAQLNTDGLMLATMALGGIMYLMVKSIDEVPDENGIKKAFAAIEMAAALVLVSKALEPLANVNSDRLLLATLSVGAMLVVMVGALMELDKHDPKKLIASGFSAVLMAGSLVMISKALEPLANSKPEGVFIAALAIGALLVVMAGILVDVSKVGPKAILGGIAAIEMAVSMALIAQAMAPLANANPGSLIVAAIAIGVLLVAMAGALLFVGEVGPMAILGGIAAIEMAFAMSMVVNAMMPLTSIDVKALENAVNTMGYLLLEMCVALYAISAMGPMALLGGASAVLMALAMGMVANTLIMLTAIPVEKIYDSIKGLGLAMVALAGVTALVGALSPLILIAFETLLLAAGMISLSILALVPAIDSLASVIDKIATAVAKFQNANVTGFAENVPVLAGAIALLGLSLKTFGLASGIGADALNTMADAIQKLAPALTMLAKVPGDQLSAVMTALSVGFAEFGLSLKTFGFFSGIGANALNTLADAVTKLAPALTLLSSVPGPAISNTMTALASGFSEFGASLKSFGFFSGIGADAMNTLSEAVMKLAPALSMLARVPGEQLAQTMGAIGGGFSVFGQALKDVPLLFGGTKAETLNTLCDGIVKLAGALPLIATLDPEAVKTSLASIGAAFESFGTAIENTPLLFAKGRAESIGTLCEQITKLADGLTYFLQQDFDADVLDVTLTKLGTAFQSFGTAINNTPVLFANDRAGSIGTLCEQIQKLADGMVYFMGSGADADGFYSSLIKVGSAFNAFGGALKNTPIFNTDERAAGISILVNNIKNLADGMNYFIQNSPGEEFGTTLDTVKSAFVTFASALRVTPWFKADVRANGMATMINNIKELADGVNYFQENTGENALSALDGIKTSMATFSDALKDTPFWNAEGRSNAMTNVIKSMNDLADAVVKLGSNEGDPVTAMGALAGGTELLGTAFTTYWSGVSDDQITMFNNAVTAIQTVAGIDSAALISVNDALRNMLTWMQTLVSIDTEQMSSFSESLQSFATEGINAFVGAFDASSGAIANSTTKFVQQVCAQLKGKSTMFMAPGDAAGRAYLEAIKVTAVAQGPVTAIDIVNAVVQAIKALEQQFRDVGISSALAYVRAIEDQESKARTAGEKLGNAVLDALKKLEDDFKTVGANCAMGFANGLANNEALKLIAQNAAAMGQKAVEATREATQVQSPSRKFMWIGQMCGIGLVKGLNSMRDAVAEASVDLGNNTVTSLNDAIKSIYSLANDYMNFDPTIRPDVDLSNIRRATDETTRLFNQAISRSALNAEIASSRIISQRPTRTAEEIQNGVVGTGNTYYSFVQNNNSPKPLSRLEIYRDTRSLLKQVEGI